MLTESWRVICESLRTSVRGVGLLGLGLCALPALAASPAAGQTRESAPVNGSPSKLADAIRPFWINIPESKLVDLRERVIATRWPDKETVTDQSQGVQLSKIQSLVRCCRCPLPGTDYDIVRIVESSRASVKSVLMELPVRRVSRPHELRNLPAIGFQTRPAALG